MPYKIFRLCRKYMKQYHTIFNYYKSISSLKINNSRSLQAEKIKMLVLTLGKCGLCQRYDNGEGCLTRFWYFYQELCLLQSIENQHLSIPKFYEIPRIFPKFMNNSRFPRLLATLITLFHWRRYWLDQLATSNTLRAKRKKFYLYENISSRKSRS